MEYLLPAAIGLVAGFAGAFAFAAIQRRSQPLGPEAPADDVTTGMASTNFPVFVEGAHGYRLSAGETNTVLDFTLNVGLWVILVDIQASMYTTDPLLVFDPGGLHCRIEVLGTTETAEGYFHHVQTGMPDGSGQPLQNLPFRGSLGLQMKATMSPNSRIKVICEVRNTEGCFADAFATATAIPLGGGLRVTGS